MKVVSIWDVLNGEDGEYGERLAARALESFQKSYKSLQPSDEDLVEQYAENTFSENDYPASQQVAARFEDGTVRHYLVEMEPVPQFYIRKVETVVQGSEVEEQVDD